MRLYTFALLACFALLQIRAGQTEFVILVTGDGIRHQEVFTGADPALMLEENKKSSGAESVPRLREEFGDDDPRVRREKLMPFFWKELSRHGVILGNRSRDSIVNVANPHRFSYPGYAEILNGQPVVEVTSNDPNFSPRRTLLEFIRAEFQLLPEKSALFGSWKIFNWIGMQKQNAAFSNAGYDAMPERFMTEQIRVWSDLQFDTLSPWDTVRHDSVTLGLALEYLKTQKPKFLYLALGETDDWAHNRRYDRTLQTLKFFDTALERLWILLQETEPYRGKTTLVITTDHGRGRALDDWTSHGKNVPGAEEAWIAIFGPDTPARGEASRTPPYTLSNIAATILQFYELDPEKFNPAAAAPIAEAFQASKHR